ncbi:MAG: hypothetical protein ABR524_05180 [Thermoanaerobaculia bacterium]
MSLGNCIACDAGSDTMPLIEFEYRGERHRICSAHLPILIHDPGQLHGRLAGAETLPASEHND